MKRLIYVMFIILFAGVTFFGLGPVFLADGSFQERMVTLAVVIIIYLVLIGLFLTWRRKTR